MAAPFEQNRSHLFSDEDARAKNSAARLSIFAAAFLIVLKSATGWLTGSISV